MSMMKVFVRPELGGPRIRKRERTLLLSRLDFLESGMQPVFDDTCNLVGVEEKHMQGELEHFCRDAHRDHLRVYSSPSTSKNSTTLA
jgi:hypothetical protein